MFKQRHFPPGTFIETPKRIMAIIQLCLAFTLIAWALLNPFIGDYFNLQSDILFFQTTIGDATLLAKFDNARSIAFHDKLHRNATRFRDLPEQDQQQIMKHYQKKITAPSSFWNQIQRSIHTLVFEVPLFEQGWIVFSISISLMILLKIEGARQAAWVLPLLVFFYGTCNLWYGKAPSFSSEDAALFPTEQLLVERYLHSPLSLKISEQREQLETGWHLYLVDQWAHEIPSTNPVDLALQTEKGEYAFNLARLRLRMQNNSTSTSSYFQRREPLFLLILYVLWNCLFAYMVNRQSKLSSINPQLHKTHAFNPH